MRNICVAGALLLAACGSNNPPQPPQPQPQPPASVPFSGPVAPTAFAVTQSNFNGASATGSGNYPNLDGAFSFPLCPDANGVQTCWISYVEAPFNPTATILGQSSVTMTYTLSVNDALVWDCNSPNNQPNCHDTPYMRILLHHVGDNLSLGLPYGYYRWFSQYTNIVPGTATVTFPLTTSYFAPPVAGAVQTDMNNTLSNLSSIGFCFGGGSQHDFDCHGLAVNAGAATFKIEAYSIQ